MQVSAAETKTEAVAIEKDGRPESVIVSYEKFHALKAASEQKTIAKCQSEFNEQYKDWIAVQNDDFNTHGLWSDGLVAWQMPGF